MNAKNLYRVLFACFFLVFYWIGRMSINQENGLVAVAALVLAAFSGGMFYLSMFRPRH